MSLKYNLKKWCTRLFHDDLLYSIYWGQIYNSTIIGSDWLLQQAISPGRWAVGYEYLYVLYRCLDDVKPKKILEIGLGQSTRVISQYTKVYADQHVVVEHDSKWIDFFLIKVNVSSKTIVRCLPLEERNLNGSIYYSYKDFSTKIGNEKYDLISIDGPFGGSKYSRRDVLDCMPQILAKDFIVLVDDSGRIGERHTIKEMEQVLRYHGIEFYKGVYFGGGVKATTILASSKYNFYVHYKRLGGNHDK